MESECAGWSAGNFIQEGELSTLQRKTIMVKRNEQDKKALLDTLKKLGLEKFYPNKLTLHSRLEINKDNVYDQSVSSVEEIPWSFLRKLFRVNAGCRNITQLSSNDDEDYDLSDSDEDSADCSDREINPLDLVVALFLCADSFLQQEMALKMYMCQFSVPLLLPHANNSQCSFMLWSLRDIVKEWCPHEMSDSKGFVEDNIVQAKIPFFSFVRLKNCSLSKSQLLNQVLSRDQQNPNFFIHGGMENGTLKREIATGLVEVCWSLPCGRENLDVFPEPMAFANLRGDICQSHAQFNFLLEMSTATFVFLDKVEEDEQNILTSLQDTSKLCLVVNRKEESSKESVRSAQALGKQLNLSKSNVITKDKRVNLATFSNKLSSAIKTILACQANTLSIEDMLGRAVELGLSVDESSSDEQKKAAEEIKAGIGVQTIPDYKTQQLPLQGKNWKTLSQLEKEVCRIKDTGDSGLEKYKSELQDKEKQIRYEQSKYKCSTAMEMFISNLSTPDKQKRDFFIKWLKLNMDTNSRNELTTLRNQFKESCKGNDAKRVAELNEALVESSLGVEHYMREMGLMYEFCQQTQDIRHLPALAADLLLDGHPLELLDGDASNIPEKWLTDVLMELHKKVGKKSRLLVLTVLGVQSSGKSTLLNTMFGVQFPVSSGRCTRGAYMVFLRVGEEYKTTLKCDFIVLIDTEGLKSPHLAQLSDSYEHDNQLATFVIGLSDVTIINVAMENVNEMKDVLQIAVQAFLRMKEIGRKPVCYFVHQNVGGVSANAKCMSERKHLLDQLNAMTKMAAEMEKQTSYKAFTDVLEYDIEKNNWNIPGLWHGTPPMAPVNTGYSEHVSEFKKHVLETGKHDRGAADAEIPDFLELIKSLWKAVKYENFIFSFRNTLVAHAYDNLCKSFGAWEWEFRKPILTWQKDAELEILNADSESEESWKTLVEKKKSEATCKIQNEQKIMRQKLIDYYRRNDRHVNLVEKYKTDFVKSIERLGEDIKYSVTSKLNCILKLKSDREKAQALQNKYRTVIEENVMKLLSDSKGHTLSIEQLRQRFEKMWKETTENLSGLQEQNITSCVMEQLGKNFTNLNVTELQLANLREAGLSPFKVKQAHVNSLMKKFTILLNRDLQNKTDCFIQSCKRFIHDKAQMDEDYHDDLTQDLLQKIDEFLQENSKQSTSLQYEIDLKLHICGIASREFLEMHKRFLAKTDPRTKLQNNKEQYWKDFLDLYEERDDCQRKADNFVQMCIRPAVEDYINRSLGIDIVDEVLTSSHSAEYSSRSYFQYHIQKQLLTKDDFESFVKYINNYEIYVKDWILHHVKQELLEDKTLQKLKNKILDVIFTKITNALEAASKGRNKELLPDDTKSIPEFIDQLRNHLRKDIAVSVESERMILFQIKSTCHSFIKSLKESTESLKKQLQNNFSASADIIEILNKLSVKPQDELFKRVFGCGKQCPFCKVPCEAGGQAHQHHHPAIHRPQGLAWYSYESTKKLVETLCTTDVVSERNFRNADTNGELHPFKDYTKFYPDWRIQPDNTIEASDYWKYILVKHNDKFAERYGAKQADVPTAWKKITKEQALKGLNDGFNIK